MDTQAPASYFDREFQVEAVKLLPGQYHASRGPGSITTVLGSCVSTCLWDPVERIGGMNHFMLPGDASAASLSTVSGRLGVNAMELLINDMLRLGAQRRRLVAKVFGGARVLQAFETLDVGALNSRFVLDFLREENITVLGEDLLGVSPRKLHFFPESGKVQMRKLLLHAHGVVETQERAYRDRLRLQQDASGDVEMFQVPRR